MKVGVRKPSLKKSISARTTGRANRVVKSSINPAYSKKGVGWISDPKKAAYNKVYNKTTYSALDNTDLITVVAIAVIVFVLAVVIFTIF